MKIVTEATISSQHNLPHYLGKCHEQHGHNWRIIVMIQGVPMDKGPHVGMVMDFVLIKNIIMKYDHTNLNKYFENPTAELMCERICQELFWKGIEQGNITKVVARLFETHKSYVEVDSDDYNWEEESDADRLEQDVGSAEEMQKAREADKDVRNGSSS